MFKRLSFLSMLFSIVCVAALCPDEVLSQERPADKMQNLVKTAAGLTKDDLTALEKGEFVIKKIPAEDVREVAVYGLVKIAGTHDAVLAAFQRTIEKQKRETSVQYGRISYPPAIADLLRLKIDDGEIDDLSNCKVGDCDWNFSQEMIDKVQNELDFSTPNSRSKGSALIKEMLLDYTAGYLKNGDQSLIVYVDDPDPLSLRSEYQSILSTLSWIGELAPDLGKYLKGRGAGDLRPVEDVIDYTTVKVAFKPVLILTHSVTYTQPGEIPMSLIISKQIYANHYFDSSLAVTLIVSYPKEDGTSDTYLIFVSYSRASAFKGTIGRLTKGIVESEANSKLETVLTDTKRFTARTMNNKEELAEMSEGSNMVSSFFRTYALLWGVVLLLAFAAVFWFFTRKQKGG